MAAFIRRLGRRVRRFIRFILGKELIQRRQLCIPNECHGSEHANWVIASNIIDRHSTVYSIGVGNDITFDLSLIRQYGVIVHAFDPTPRSILWINEQVLPDEFLFHPIGIADFDGTALFHPPSNPNFVSYAIINQENLVGVSDIDQQIVEAPVRRLKTIMNELGHEKIDLLKMDIEGAEYGVIEDLLGQSLHIRQILVEFHHRHFSGGVQKTRDAIYALNKAGYRIFSVSNLGEEYSFLKLDSKGQE